MALSDHIPNNVDLSADRKLMKGLTRWQPAYLEWWRDMGPSGFDEDLIWLRTAVSVNAKGWAHYDHVRMKDYRWGIFLSAPAPEEKILFGDHAGGSLWNEVPGEYRGMLRRLIVTQADTEPASVEQQRQLGSAAPSLYDLRNLLQVNVEEGRHLWAMVHLLHQYFGKDGREEAETLLLRRSGNPDRPRILSTFNQRTDDWLSFFMFTTFTDRDGKYQLSSLTNSAFSPLARATRFMLTEEAFHLFVGESGVDRVLRRSAAMTRKDPNGEASRHGAINLETVQRYLNFWYSSCLDLFGAEISGNAADYFASSLKSRHREDRYSEHQLLDQEYSIEHMLEGSLQTQEVPMRCAMNEVLRDEYIRDCERVVKRWNATIASFGLTFRLQLPHRRFNRVQGIHAGQCYSPEGAPMDPDTFDTRRHDWLPSSRERASIQELMRPIYTPGEFASWIAAPQKGIKGRAPDFEYVRFADPHHPAA